MQTILTHSYPDTGRYAGKLRVVDELGNAEPWRPFVVDIARPTPTPTPPQIVPSWGFSLSALESVEFPRRYGGGSSVGMGAWSISAAPVWTQIDEENGCWGFYWSLENIPNDEEPHEEGFAIDDERSMIHCLDDWHYDGTGSAPCVRMRKTYTGKKWEATYPIIPGGQPPAFEARIEDRILEINAPWAITTWTGDAAALIDSQHFQMSYMGFSTLTELNYALCGGGNIRVQFDGYTIV